MSKRNFVVWDSQATAGLMSAMNEIEREEALEDDLNLKNDLLSQTTLKGRLVELVNGKTVNVLGSYLANAFCTLSGEGWDSIRYSVRGDEFESTGVRDGKKINFQFRLMPEDSRLEKSDRLTPTDFAGLVPVGEMVRKALA